MGDGRPVRHDHRVGHRRPPRPQRRDEQGTPAIGVDPRGRAGRARHDHRGPSGQWCGVHGIRLGTGHAPSSQSPERPPDFAVTRTSVMRACLSTALTMSMRASAATDTEVSASISMPVTSAVRTVAVMSAPSSATVTSTSTPWTAIGWASGMSSGVRWTAWMPAMRATARASPLGTRPDRSADTAAALSSTRPAALASRAVTALADTSTMWALPSARTCVRPPGAPDRPDASDVPDAWAPPSVRGASEALTSVLPVEHEHVHDLAGDELGDVLGDD